MQVTSYKLQKKATKLVALSDASLRSLSDHQKTIEARESGCLSLASCLLHLFFPADSLQRLLLSFILYPFS